MKLEEMVEELNEYVDGSLCITHYDCVGWELASYKDNTLFKFKDGRHVETHSFKTMVEKAYKIMQEDKKNKGGLT